MKRTIGVEAFVIFAACILTAHSVHAVVPGQIDNFENGTTMGWSHGVPGYLLNINTGGPAGVDDNCLQLRADGNGSGGRLTTFNLQQWLGNYVGQGITTIEIDLINQSSVNLSIRLAYKAQNHQTAPGYMSQAMLLPVGSGWQHFTVSLTAAMRNRRAVTG